MLPCLLQPAPEHHDLHRDGTITEKGWVHGPTPEAHILGGTRGPLQHQVEALKDCLQPSQGAGICCRFESNEQYTLSSMTEGGGAPSENRARCLLYFPLPRMLEGLAADAESSGGRGGLPGRPSSGPDLNFARLASDATLCSFGPSLKTAHSMPPLAHRLCFWQSHPLRNANVSILHRLCCASRSTTECGKQFKDSPPEVEGVGVTAQQSLHDVLEMRQHKER